MERKNKRLFYLSYTLIFLAISFFFAYFFISNGKTLINSAGDGYRQNYRGLLYYSNYLKQIFKNLFINHRIVIPAWDFSLGEGSDIFQTLFIDTIGGPIDFLSCLIPEKYIYLYHDFAIFFRLYLSGISFSLLFINKEKINVSGLLIGSLSYVFCAYGYLQATNFFFFLKPLIEAPLIVLGFEKILQNESPLLLIISVACTLIFNFYQAVIIGIVIAIYVIVRILLLETNSIKEKIVILFKTTSYVLIGIALASIVVLPSVYTFLGNPRLNNNVTFDLFYSFEQIGKILSSFVINDFLSMLFGGYSIICLISIYLLFSKKGNRTYKVLLTLGFIILFSPTLQRIFNAMSYPTERWVWAISLLLSCVVVECYEDLYKLKNKVIPIVLFLIIYYALCVYIDNEDVKLYILSFVIAISTVIFISCIKNRNLINLCAIGVTVVCIVLNLFVYLSPSLWNQVRKFASIEEALSYNTNESNVLFDIEDDSFWRYSGDGLTTNSSMQNGMHATNFYWSCSNNYVSEFRKELGLLDHNSFHYDDYDNRFSLMNLSSVKYYIDCDKTNKLPYGYKGIKDNLYISNSSLPLVYAYDVSMSEDEWKKQDLVSRQEALTQMAIINNADNSSSINKSAINYSYEIIDEDGLIIKDNRIIVNNNNASFKIKTNDFVIGEQYFVIEGLYTNSIENNNDQLNITVSADSKYSKTIWHKNPNHTRYSDRHDYLVNLGYAKNAIDYITVSFDCTGEYLFESIKYIAMSIEEEIQNLNKLNCVTINDISFENNKVISNITAESEKIICYSIPYSKGWKAYMDGNEIELSRINIMYLGTNVNKGNHKIELIYETPLLKEGIIMSTSTLCILALFCMIKKRAK